MDDFGMIMGDEMVKENIRQPYVVMRDDGDDVCFLSDSETHTFEDVLGGYAEDSPLYFVEELEEKHLLGQIDVLNNLFSKLQDYQKPAVHNGISARVSAQKTTPVLEDNISKLETKYMFSFENMNDPNYCNVSSPDHKRQRKPNGRYSDLAGPQGQCFRPSTTDNSALKGSQPHEFAEDQAKETLGRTHNNTSSSYLVDVLELQATRDLITDADESEQPMVERNVFIQADELHDGFESNLGTWAHDYNGHSNEHDMLPSSTPKQGNQTSRKSAMISCDANDHQLQNYHPDGSNQEGQHPGKRRPKPNPRFLDEGLDILTSPEKEKMGVLNGHSRIQPKNDLFTNFGMPLSESNGAANNGEGLSLHAMNRDAAARVRRSAARSKVLSGSLRMKKRRRQREEEGRYRSVHSMGMGDGSDGEGDSENEDDEDRMDDMMGREGSSMAQRRKKTRTHVHVGGNRDRELAGSKTMYLSHRESDTDTKYQRKLAHQKAHSREHAGGEGMGRRSKHHNPWALEEAEALVEGVAQCGGGKWADIKKLGHPAIQSRSAVDLKDKWRNLLRIAMLPTPPAPKTGDKKREIPSSLLARVRELASRTMKVRPPDGRSKRSRSSESP